jgi:hypothetical protein
MSSTCVNTEKVTEHLNLEQLPAEVKPFGNETTTTLVSQTAHDVNEKHQELEPTVVKEDLAPASTPQVATDSLAQAQKVDKNPFGLKPEYKTVLKDFFVS